MTQPETPTRFRDFEPGDAPELFAWLDGAGLACPSAVQGALWIERICSDPRILCVTGTEADGAIFGFFRLDVAPDRTAELTLIVGPDGRRRGRGSKLLEAALVRARELRLRRLLAVVAETNQKAQRFFARRGFEPTGVWLPQTVHLARVVHGSQAEPPLEISV